MLHYIFVSCDTITDILIQIQLQEWNIENCYNVKVLKSFMINIADC
jgi:hypothetical protein